MRVVSPLLLLCLFVLRVPPQEEEEVVVAVTAAAAAAAAAGEPTNQPNKQAKGGRRRRDAARSRCRPMLRCTRFVPGRAPPVIGQTRKARFAGIDDNPTITFKPWDTSEPLMADYGWSRGQLPKFRARSPFHRQQIARRMVTEMIRKDYCIVGGARAPALRILADHVVELAKAGDTDSRQHLAYFLHDPLMVDKAFDEYPRRFRDMNGKYAMMTRLKSRRRTDGVAMYFVEYKNRDMSDNHKGEDYSAGPERFFLPPRIIETEKGIQRPPHMQMAFDRWASKFKTEEFHHWWRLRHAKLRYWGVRNVPHPSDVDPLWTEKEEEEWHNEMLANTGEFEDLDLEDDNFAASGEGGEPSADGVDTESRRRL